MHDNSIKLLAVVEGPRELWDEDDEDDDNDSPHYCQANDRIRCMMTALTAEGDKSAEKKQNKKKRGRDVNDVLFLKKDISEITSSFSFI